MTSSDIASIKDQLDPVAKILINHFEDVTQELRSVIQSLNEQIKDLREQNEELRRMLFGSRSEKMPSIASEIRRQVEEKELFPPPSDDDPKEPAPRLTDEEKEKRKRQRARCQGAAFRIALGAAKRIRIKKKTQVG